MLEVPAASADAPPGRIDVRCIEPEPGAGTALIPPARPVAAEPAARGGQPAARPARPAAGTRRRPLLLGAVGVRALRLPLLRRAGARDLGARGAGRRRRARRGRRRRASPPTPATASGPASRCTRCSSGAPATAGGSPAPSRRARRCASRGSSRARPRSSPSGRSSSSAPGSASPLRSELEGARIAAEVPFVLSISDTLVRGSIDLLAELPDGRVLVIDYKTDRLRGREPEAAASRLRRPARHLRARRGGARAPRSRPSTCSSRSRAPRPAPSSARTSSPPPAAGSRRCWPAWRSATSPSPTSPIGPSATTAPRASGCAATT